MTGLIVDLFAGGGGASTGLARALGRDPDIAINHDAEALAMHKANHPRTQHLQNDITKILPLEATGGRPVAILHASPDCTHFSKAKGGKPRSQYIRDLAWVVVRWAEDTRPMLISLENVEEFLTWGPLDKTGHPIKSQAGATFAAWRKRLTRLGYRVEWRLLRACDYGAPTTRRRLFVVARRDKRPIIWPTPTHGNPKSAEVRSGKLLPWRTAAECIDWSMESQSIFDRKKPLALATQRRIAEGLRRYVLQATKPFIVTYYGAKKPHDCRAQDLSQPLPTQTTGHAPTPVDMPVATLTTGTQQMVAGAVVAPLLSRQFGCSIGQRVDAPHPTITQCNHDALIEAACIAKYYGKSECAAVDAPLHTLTSKEHMALTSACLVKYYGTAKAACVGEPMHTITTKARMGLVEAEAHKDAVTGRYEQVCDFLRTWGVIGPEEEAEFVYRGIVHRITDILMRMLVPRELYTAQGFPASYIIDRLPNGERLTKTAQIRMCGNSVPPALVAALVKANGPETWASLNPPFFPLLSLGDEKGYAEGWT